MIYQYIFVQDVKNTYTTLWKHNSCNAGQQFHMKKQMSSKLHYPITGNLF